MRFYNLDGIEEDVQDPKFFMVEEELIDTQEAITDLLETYYV